METRDLTQLQSEFDGKIEEVKKFSFQMKEKKKMIKENFLSWTGGIVGMFARMRDDKKMNQFLETPILDGMTYQQLAEHLGEMSTSLSNIQKQIQDMVSKDHPRYYGNVYEINKVMVESVKSWQDIAPTVANETFKTANGKTTLLEYAYVTVAHPLNILDLPDDL